MRPEVIQHEPPASMASPQPLEAAPCAYHQHLGLLVLTN